MKTIIIIIFFAGNIIACCARDCSRELRHHTPEYRSKNILDSAIHQYFRNDSDKDNVLGAVKILDSAIIIDSLYYVAYEMKASFLLAAKDYDMALSVVKEMLRLNPESADLYRYQGLLYYKTGNFNNSLASLRHSLRLSEQDFESAKNSLDSLIIDTTGDSKSKDLKPFINAYKKSMAALEDKAVGLVLVNNPEGKIILDSLSLLKKATQHRESTKNLNWATINHASINADFYKDKTKEQIIEYYLFSRQLRPARIGIFRHNLQLSD